MPAGLLDITLEQGARFYRQVFWKDSSGTAVNLTGYTPAMKIRKRFDSAAALLDCTSYCSVASPATDGKIIIDIPASATASLDFLRGVYDLEVTASTITVRLLQGAVVFAKEATR